jgi:hypothetical protein
MKRVLFAVTPPLVTLLLAGCPANRPSDAAGSRPLLADVLAREGYVASHADGRTLYCRTELATGTLLRKKTCRTEEQIAIERQATAATATDLRRTRGLDCSGPQHLCGD